MKKSNVFQKQRCKLSKYGAQNETYIEGWEEKT